MNDVSFGLVCTFCCTREMAKGFFTWKSSVKSWKVVNRNFDLQEARCHLMDLLRLVVVAIVVELYSGMEDHQSHLSMVEPLQVMGMIREERMSQVTGLPSITRLYQVHLMECLPSCLQCTLAVHFWGEDYGILQLLLAFCTINTVVVVRECSSTEFYVCTATLITWRYVCFFMNLQGTCAPMDYSL
jgi:hypothetical protein